MPKKGLEPLYRVMDPPAWTAPNFSVAAAIPFLPVEVGTKACRDRGNRSCLQDEVVGSGVARGPLVEIPFHRGKDHDRDFQLRSAKFAHQLKPVPCPVPVAEFRSEIEFHEDRIEVSLFGAAQRGLQGMGQFDAVTEALKSSRELSGDRGFVIGKKYRIVYVSQSQEKSTEFLGAHRRARTGLIRICRYATAPLGR